MGSKPEEWFLVKSLLFSSGGLKVMLAYVSDSFDKDDSLVGGSEGGSWVWALE